ncbi:MAG TPA: hypothetical protein VIQ31_17845 [Phormidium sp.]
MRASIKGARNSDDRHKSGRVIADNLRPIAGVRIRILNDSSIAPI